MNVTTIDQRILNLRKAVAQASSETTETIMDMAEVKKDLNGTYAAGVRLDWDNAFYQWSDSWGNGGNGH